MKKIFLLIVILLLLKIGYSQSNDQSSFIGLNLFPLQMTQIELLYDKNFNPYFTAQIRAGYVIDAPYGSFSHLLSNEDLTRRSGPFIKIGIKTHLNNKIITPFLGFRIVNSLSMEKGLGGCPSYLL